MVVFNRSTARFRLPTSFSVRAWHHAAGCKGSQYASRWLLRWRSSLSLDFQPAIRSTRVGVRR
jgi:hypothetical protein